MSKRPAVVLLLAGALTFGPTPRSAAAAPGTPGALSAPSVPASGPAPASKPAPALRAAADRVLFGFRELVEPPPQQLSFLDIAELESGAPMRAYVLRSHAAAIDALLALATTPEASARVGKVMRQLDQGRSHEGEVWLEELSRNDAAAARHLAALRELPAALGARMSPSDAGLRFHGGLDRDNRVAGSLAESDYRRAAALDPGDPWTWLVLAWLDDMRAEADLTRCLAAARTAGNVQVQILAQQQLARVAQLQGRQAEARGAWFAAAKLAGDAAGRAGSGIGTREHAQALSALAIHLAANGSTAEARQMLRKVLDMRWQLVREQRNVLPIELELVGSLQRLGRLQREAGLVPPGSTPANDLEQQAWLVYQAMERSAPYRPQFANRLWPGIVASTLAQAAVITLLGALLLLALYRRRIGQLMMAAASSSAAAPLALVAPAAAPGPAHAPAGQPRAGLIAGAAASLRHAAAVQVVAGIGFGLVATCLQVRADELEMNLNRVLLLSWSWAWPTALALGLLWAGDRRRQATVLGVYFGGLALICLRIALSGTEPLKMFGVTLPAFFQGLVFWAVTIGWSPLLLLFLNRKVRSVGPPLMLMMLVASGGAC